MDIVNIWEHNSFSDSIQRTGWKERSIYGFSEPFLYTKETEFRDKMNSGKIARFKVEDIKYENDPKDMFWATLYDVGYLE